MQVLKNKLLYAGADGGRAGWFAIALTRKGQWQAEVFRDIAELWEKYQKASLIPVDVPIGLKETGTEDRCCDKDARKLLGPPRASSVFRVPCRESVYATTYEDASAINFQQSTYKGNSSRGVFLGFGGHADALQ
jgi:predicted RNase H-like nuclease